MSSATDTKTTTQALTDLLLNLVRFRTLSHDHDANREALDWVQEQLEGLPLITKRFENQGFPALVATTTGAANHRAPKLWLGAHMDVVDAPDPEFDPYVRDGRLYGRGSHDMKFAIAVFITLLQELGSSLEDYDLGFMITTDEELGGFKGVKWLLDDLGYRGDVALIPDCNGSWTMEMGAKGIVWWELSATGRAAHAGRTWDGVNAIDEIMKFVEHVRHNIVQEPCGDDNHKHTTVNLGNIRGGSSVNKVADSAVASLDVRYTPGDGIEKVLDWVAAAEKTVPTVKARSLMTEHPYVVAPHQAVDHFNAVTQAMIGKMPTPIIAHGSSDARHFAKHAIPTINVTPHASGFHVDGEWIDLADLHRYYKVVQQFTEERTRLEK
jgi:succinyl-diaminopimelate desuccinylase